MDIIYGFIIGAASILPGISGSVIAIILGIYEKVINILNNKEKINIKIKKLLPLGIGFILGIITFSNFLLLFFKKFEIPFKYMFIGIVLASTNILNNKIIEKENKNLNIKVFLITLILSLIIFSLNITFSKTNISNIRLFISGIFYISGKVIPGISSTAFMILFGIYDYILMFFSNPISFLINNFYKCVLFMLGSIFGLIIFIKLINYLFKNHYRNTYSAIIGLTLSSIIYIFPGIEFNTIYGVSFVFLIITYVLTYIISKHKIN